MVKVFSDNDRSASRHARKDRPGYTQVKQFLDAGGADVLVLWEGSRAQRDLRDYLKLRDLCEQRNVLYCYSGRVHDLTRTEDRFSTGLDALLAEREADLTRDRVLRGVRAHMTTGRPYGRLLYGYRRVYDDRGVFVEQVAHEEQAAVIREAARRVMAGEACRAVALDFNARGIPAAAGGKWDLTQVRRMVTQPAYIGHKVHKGQVVGQGDWPALLDETTYAACVARMADPRRKAMRDGSLRHPLSGAICCGVCGGFMRVQKNRGFFAYICEDGFCVSAKVSDLEQYISAVIVERLSRLSLSDLLGPTGDDLVGQARVEHADLTARLEGFHEQAIAGKITPVSFAKIEARLTPMIADAARRASPAPVPQVLRDVVGDGAAIAWEGLSVAIKREIICLLAEIKIQRVGRGTRTFRPERVEITWKTPG